MFPYKIFSTEYSEKCDYKDVLIICYLYYEDTLERYYSYIRSIPNEIDICLVSSNKRVLSKVQKEITNKKLIFIHKENRGRDLSALLVACRSIIKNYKYICFTHDKKPISEHLHKDTDIWVEVLWSSMLASQNYINNIVNYFRTNSQIGLLIPPEPFGDYFTTKYSYLWGENFENTQKLAHKLNLDIHFSADNPPEALGSVFWARLEALKPLFQYKWQYNDFPEEPMPADGTISHSIERILPFIAQEAGYITEKIVSDYWASKIINFWQDTTTILFPLLDKDLNIFNLHDLKINYSNKVKATTIIKNNIIYIYGAGKCGQKAFNILRLWGYSPQGYIVSNNYDNNVPMDIPIYKIDEVKNNLSNSTIIIATFTEAIRKEIFNTLSSYGINECFWFDSESNSVDIYIS
ncbi:MAG: rhamnan synthesis F family protein [Lachnospiraceae bacterium]|nr:rhamnan synthesis F family protein [Lachnospiraceae bacterium]